MSNICPEIISIPSLGHTSQIPSSNTDDDGYTTPDEDGEYDEKIEAIKQLPNPEEYGTVRDKPAVTSIPFDKIRQWQRDDESWIQGPHDQSLERTCHNGRTFKELRKKRFKPGEETRIVVLHASFHDDRYLLPIILMTKTPEPKKHHQRIMATLMCNAHFSIKLPMYIWLLIFNNFLENKNALYHILYYRETFIEQPNGKWLGVPCIKASLYEELEDDEKDPVPWRY